MAIDDYKLLGCPICGLRVDTHEDACSRCGHRFSKDTKFECPFCGEPVPSGSTKCPTCHIDFSTFASDYEGRVRQPDIDNILMDIIKLESSQVKAEAKKLSCPRCAWLLDGTEEECPKCKLDFEQDYSFQCPICGEPVGAEETTCPVCGSSFVDEEAHKVTEKAHEDVAMKLSEIMEVAAEEVPEQGPPRLVPPEPVMKAPKVVSRPHVAEVQALEQMQETVRPEMEPEPEPEPVNEEPEEVQPSPQKKHRQRKLKAKSGPKKKA